MTEFRGLPPGPNVGTQLKALRRKQKLELAKRVSQAATAHDVSSISQKVTDALPATPAPLAKQLLKALTLADVEQWFVDKGWKPFPFQKQTWQAMRAGHSGLLHATTGSGKTLAVWLGALLRCASLQAPRGACTRVMWVTPMRALAADSTQALLSSVNELANDCPVQMLTGDTEPATRTAIQKKPPFGLVTTPESLTLMLAKKDNLPRLSNLQVLVVDEWHELIGNKRGVQLQLAVARLVKLNPSLVIWGLSATLGNLPEAQQVLLHPISHTLQPDRPGPLLVEGKQPKSLVIDTLIPDKFERFPWGGHIGLKQLDRVLAEIEAAGTTLIFTNTRSQAEIWFHALLEAKPELAGLLALHHGSLDKSVREFVEQGLKQGMLKAVVCTSSLDLGVDFLPVERVIQIGSPKGVARLLQRAGRSGHAPGRPSRVTLVPTHALEMMEAAAARYAVQAKNIEQRVSPTNPLDVLAQHLVTIAMGGGFQPDDLYQEVKLAYAYRQLTRAAFDWALSFVEKGGDSLKAYPDYQRVSRLDDGRYAVTRRDIARRHAMSVGTIVSDSSMQVAWMTGGKLGTVEEGFIARLNVGDCFSFAGRVLELVRVREMTAYVRKANRNKAVVPNWVGGKMPLSSELAAASLAMLNKAELALRAAKLPDEPELQALQGLFATQNTWSALPGPNTLLIEQLTSREGYHLFFYPFEGRTVHTGLASLFAWRASQSRPNTFSIAVNDYGFELLTAEPIDWKMLITAAGKLTPKAHKRAPLFEEARLLDDITASLNASELSQRRFREIARISGLVFQGFPGAGKSARQLQASSSLFWEVLTKHDPSNRLLQQARQEALEQELELNRLKHALSSMKEKQLVFKEIAYPTPFAFPLLIERLRESVSTESLQDRISKMVQMLEAQAG